MPIKIKGLNMCLGPVTLQVYMQPWACSLFQVQGINPKCESVKTSDYVVDLKKNKKILLVIYCNT